jgi:hypothetical protein
LKIDFLYHHIKIIQKHKKYINLNYKKKKNSNFFKAFLKCKNKHALIRKCNPTSNEKKIIITQLLYNIKKVPSIYIWRLSQIQDWWVWLKVGPNSIWSGCQAKPNSF